jgi:putative endonuclease
MKCYGVYILASKKNGTLYTGVTGNLLRRVHQHKNAEMPGFTSRYGVSRLVYFETFTTISAAINREKCIKKWRRKWKIELIEQCNSDWKDLYERLVRETGFPLARE